MGIRKQFYSIQPVAIFLVCLITHIFFIYLIFIESIFLTKIKPVSASSAYASSHRIQVNWQSDPDHVPTQAHAVSVNPIQVNSSSKIQHAVKQQKRIATPEKNITAVVPVVEKQQTNPQSIPANSTHSAKTHSIVLAESAIATSQTQQLHEHETVSTQSTAVQAPITEKTVQSVSTSESDIQAISRRVNYPSRARALGVEGRVKVQFDISENGAVRNIQIIEETPKGVFVNGLMQDMARWRYRVVYAVKNQVVHIVFRLDGRVVVENQ